MTMQAREIVKYRGEQYSLFANPLYSYLETRKNISFEMYTTAHWRGYQGFWELKEDKLYLTALSSANHTIQTIFQKPGPILAEWFSGAIEIGIGKPTYTKWDITYDNYLWLKLDKGIVVEKKIVKQIDSNPTINSENTKAKLF